MSAEGDLEPSRVICNDLGFLKVSKNRLTMNEDTREDLRTYVHRSGLRIVLSNGATGADEVSRRFFDHCK